MSRVFVAAGLLLSLGAVSFAAAEYLRDPSAGLVEGEPASDAGDPETNVRTPTESLDSSTDALTKRDQEEQDV